MGAQLSLNHILKGPMSKYSPVLRSQGLGFQHVNLGRYNGAGNPYDEPESDIVECGRSTAVSGQC